MIMLTFMALLFSPPDVGLMLARSCVGEAGFNSVQTGECAAIAHVYQKRAAISKRGFYWTMRRYSAAVKPKYGRSWVLGLNRSASRPKGFGSGGDWKRFKELWIEALAFADAFLLGKVPDPLPSALHYGGWIDRNNLDQRYWKIIECKFRNRFYEKRVSK